MNALQEEITQKTLALCVEASKMTAQLLQQAMKKVLADMEKHKKIRSFGTASRRSGSL